MSGSNQAVLIDYITSLAADQLRSADLLYTLFIYPFPVASSAFLSTDHQYYTSVTNRPPTMRKG